MFFWPYGNSVLKIWNEGPQLKKWTVTKTRNMSTLPWKQVFFRKNPLIQKCVSHTCILSKLYLKNTTKGALTFSASFAKITFCPFHSHHLILLHSTVALFTMSELVKESWRWLEPRGKNKGKSQMALIYNLPLFLKYLFCPNNYDLLNSWNYLLKSLK